jgi:2-oxoglutarate ferredoxin oxidoreductase subunit beta
VRSYAFNSVHGRALPIATGLKLSRPELTTVVVGGDGDGFSIGLGHLPHAMRRNVDLTYAVLDNGIYGLTKGQASPTTDPDLKAELGLAGASERPLNPVLLVLGSGCGFVARTHAGNLPHLRAMFREAIAYPGFSFVHILAACVTYQPLTYADALWKRCSMIPDEYDAASFDSAIAMARAEKFMLGVFYRRPPELAVTAGPEEVASSGVWPPIGATSESTFPG